MENLNRKADRQLTVEQIKEKYFSNIPTAEELNAKHLLHLAECEENNRNNGIYNGISNTYKQNSIKRINRYITNRTEAEKLMPEYKIFIASMEKSLAMMT